jgi:UDP-N-acetylmuramyl pentapeptide phosphotransferase/UDP-N-acetylglucosamine-1-phosphate transferase
MDMTTTILLAAFAVALVACAIFCIIALQLFPWFRSGERKEGNFRPDQSTGTYKIGPAKQGGKRVTIRVSSNELPLVGGPALLLATLAGVAVTAFWLNLSMDDWILLGILMACLVGFGLVGFLDDWRKVRRGQGITEIQKLIGVALVSIAAAVAFHRLINPPFFLSARFAYPPYSEIPVIGQVLVHVRFAWPIFFVLMTLIIGSTTSLAVDFSDGMDGLCGGLLLSASLAFSVILIKQEDSSRYLPLALVTLAVAGASLGYLPFNWPSSWRARQPGPKRRARLIMGDTGSLALGGVLALVALISRLEFLLIIIGGVFVLEGLSALISARILVKFYRRFLTVERYGKIWYPHTEFPLPFLATPLHYHFDLLHWNRSRIVYSAWLLGAVLGTLGVASVMAPLTWERYLARFVGLLTIVVVWEMGPWTRSFFVGLARTRKDAPNTPRHLALFYGYPFKLFGRPLHHCVDITSVRENALEGPVEELLLWQRISVFDARSLLGYYCYRAGALDDAERVWSRLPKPNQQVRPEIEALVAEVRMEQAMQQEQEDEFLQVGASGVHSMPLGSGDPNSSQWRMQVPNGPQPTRLEPTDPQAAPPQTTHATGAPLWNAASWAAAAGADDEGQVGVVPVVTPADSPGSTTSGKATLVPTQDLPPEPTQDPTPAPTAEVEGAEVPSEASSSGAHWP